jgi:D-alanyl-D-alanine carboxypeptidase/D-alanyl-D-alanine-endopeptidase (penicillin-binding protein 4)
MKTVYLFICLFLSTVSYGQLAELRLTNAFKTFENDNQFKHAIISLYVVDSKTGRVVFDKNAQVGLAPASCLKVLTSASAFELLGKDYRYKTYLGTDAQGDHTVDAGSLFIIGRGDPTLGSWRWKSTTDTNVFSRIAALLQKNKLRRFSGNLYVDDLYYGLLPMPEGWIWQDIGNYFGAPCFGFNWHENQYDLLLQPGEQEGASTAVLSINPKPGNINLYNGITTGAKGSGDNAIIYSSPYSQLVLTKGTIPLQKGGFKISGSMGNPTTIFKNELAAYLKKTGIALQPESYAYSEQKLANKPVYKATSIVDSILSPSLDSINYWFMQKSINLYGEAFLKAIGKKYHPDVNTDNLYDSSISIIKEFWSKNGIDKPALNIIDGSGLSPANRVTTNALVAIMQYAKKQSWFPSFYEALPEQNGIKMKSGYIGGVRSYTGYINSRSGNAYTFSFIINNYDGSPAAVREKMWKLLDILK